MKRWASAVIVVALCTNAKVTALGHYRSQQHRNYANEEYIRNLARTHGIESGRELAEVFEVYRWIL